MDNKEKSTSYENKFSLLLSYIRKESIDEVKEVLQKWSYLLNSKDRNGRSALHYCTEHSSALCADMIIEKCPELLTAQDNDGYTALHLCVISGNQTLTRYLISKSDTNYLNCCDNEMHTAIHWATVCGELECLDLLLNAGALPSTADIHGAYPIHYSAQMCSPHSGICIGNDSKIGLSVLNRLLESPNVDVNCIDNDGRSPLLWAASAGSGDALIALINAGSQISSRDKDGLTALHCASSRGHIDCVETLLSLCGADINQMDANGCAPLFYAVTLGHADCTRLLIQSGADVNRQDFKGRTAAHCGAAKGQLETIKILGQHGANLWLRNIRGDLPLHEAVKSGRKELVKWLLEQMPAAVNATNSFGRSSLHISAINNNIEMCKILIDVGADVNTVMKFKGHFITPLDAALQKGYRGVAKYLLLRGALPASRISHGLNKAVVHRSLSEHHQIDHENFHENPSPVDSLDDWKTRTESSEFTLPSQTHTHNVDNQRTHLPKLPTLVSHIDQNPDTSSSTTSSLVENGNHVRNVREFETQLNERPSNLKQAIITNVYVTNTPICHSKRVPPLKKAKKKRKSVLEHEETNIPKVYTPSLSSSSSQINSEDNKVRVVLEMNDNSNYSSVEKIMSTDIKEYEEHFIDETQTSNQNNFCIDRKSDEYITKEIHINGDNEIEVIRHDLNKLNLSDNKLSQNETIQIGVNPTEDNKPEYVKSEYKEFDQILNHKKSNDDLDMSIAKRYREEINENLRITETPEKIERENERIEDKILDANKSENISVHSEKPEREDQWIEDKTLDANKSEEISVHSAKSSNKAEEISKTALMSEELDELTNNINVEKDEPKDIEMKSERNSSKEMRKKEFANKADQFIQKIEEIEKYKENSKSERESEWIEDKTLDGNKFEEISVHSSKPEKENEWTDGKTLDENESEVISVRSSKSERESEWIEDKTLDRNKSEDISVHSLKSERESEWIEDKILDGDKFEEVSVHSSRPEKENEWTDGKTLNENESEVISVRSSKSERESERIEDKILDENQSEEISAHSPKHDPKHEKENEWIDGKTLDANKSEKISVHSAKSSNKAEETSETALMSEELDELTNNINVEKDEQKDIEMKSEINSSKEVKKKEFENKANQFIQKIEEIEKYKEKLSIETEDYKINSNIDMSEETAGKMNDVVEGETIVEKTREVYEEIDDYREIDSKTYIKSDNESESGKSTISSTKDINSITNSNELTKKEEKEFEKSSESNKSAVKYKEKDDEYVEKSCDKKEEIQNLEIDERISLGENSNEQENDGEETVSQIHKSKESKTDSSSESAKTILNVEEVNEDKVEEKCLDLTQQIDTKLETIETNESNEYEKKSIEKSASKLAQNICEDVICYNEEKEDRNKTEDKMNEIENKDKESESKSTKPKSEIKNMNRGTEKIKNEDKIMNEKQDYKIKAQKPHENSYQTSKKTVLKQTNEKSYTPKNVMNDTNRRKSISKQNYNKPKVISKPSNASKTVPKTPSEKEQVSKHVSKVRLKRDDNIDNKRKVLLKEGKVVENKAQLSSNDLTLNKTNESETQKYANESKANSSSNQAINSIESQNQKTPFFSSEESIFDSSLMFDSEQTNLAIQTSKANKIDCLDDLTMNTLTPLDHIEQNDESPTGEQLVTFSEYNRSTPFTHLKCESRCSHKLHFKTFPANVGKVEIGHIGSKVDSRLDCRYPVSKSVSERDVTRHGKEKVRRIKIIRPSSDGYKSVDLNIITQTVEKSLRKYQLERKLFEELHDLKRFQIRSGRSNEILMVKRLVDRFRKEVKAPGMTDFEGPYTYKTYEFYLYDQLRKLSTSNQGKVALLTRSASYENMLSIANSNASITCSNPEIVSDAKNEESLNVELQKSTKSEHFDDNAQIDDQYFDIVEQTLRIERIAQTLQNITSQNDGIIQEKIPLNHVEKQDQTLQNHSIGNNREIDFNNFYNETEIDYTKFDRKPIEEKACERITSQTIAYENNDLIPESDQSIEENQFNSKNLTIKSQQIDSQLEPDFQQTKQTLEENVVKEIEKCEKTSIVLNNEIENIETQDSKEINEQSFESVNESNEQMKDFETYINETENCSKEQNENNLVEEQITSTRKPEQLKRQSTIKCDESQTDQISTKSTNGSIKSRKSGATDKRSIYSGCSSKKSATSLASNKSKMNYSNTSSAFNRRRNINTHNRQNNEKPTFKKECLKPVIDMEPSERAKNRPKFKRTKMIIPHKQQFNIPLDSIRKRWTDIKEAEMRKLCILRKYNSNPDVYHNFYFTLWFELNKSHKGFQHKFSSNQLCVKSNTTQDCLQRTFSDSALNIYYFEIT